MEEGIARQQAEAIVADEAAELEHPAGLHSDRVGSEGSVGRSGSDTLLDTDRSDVSVDSSHGRGLNASAPASAPLISSSASAPLVRFITVGVASSSNSDSEIAQFNHGIQVLASTLQRVQEGNLTPGEFADQAFLIAEFVSQRVPYAGASYGASEQRGAR